MLFSWAENVFPCKLLFGVSLHLSGDSWSSVSERSDSDRNAEVTESESSSSEEVPLHSLSESVNEFEFPDNSLIRAGNRQLLSTPFPPPMYLQNQMWTLVLHTSFDPLKLLQ